MAPLLSSFSLLLLHAATLTPATVPASGSQEALLTLDAPTTLHLGATSPAGTACTIVDRVRGPFATSGTVGGKSCSVDLTLDSGQYKLRLESPKRGKGNVTLQATPFEELNPTPIRLKAGNAVSTTLKLGQQRSYWVSAARGVPPFIRVAGRNAGDVRLWRNGEWLDPTLLRHAQIAPSEGEPLHEWWLDRALEEGDYKLVISGRDAVTVTNASVDDSLAVSADFKVAPAGSSVDFTVPVGGLFQAEIPGAAGFTLMTVSGSPSANVELQVIGINAKSELRINGACRLPKASLVPECSAASLSTDVRRVLFVRGPVGTKGRLEWVPLTGATWRNGSYGYGGGRLVFDGSTGDYLVGMHALPLDTDAAPTICALERYDAQGKLVEVVGRAMTKIGDGVKLEHTFNYDESGAIIGFEVTSSGRFHIKTDGERHSRCELYQLTNTGAMNRLTQTKPDAKSCDETMSLGRGQYQLQLFEGLSGIEKLSIAEDGAKTNAPIMHACSLGVRKLVPSRYAVVATGGLKGGVQGLVAVPLPLDLTSAVHLSLEAGSTLELPVKAGPEFLVRSSGGASFGCKNSRDAALFTSTTCSVPTRSANDTLTFSNPSAAPINVTLLRPVPMTATDAPAPYTPQLKPMTRISTETAVPFDFAREESHSALFEVATAGLYNATTTGLLSTACSLRTPVIDGFARDENSGRGRNCLIQTYLQPGRYLFTATTRGASKGRGALLLTKRNAKDMGALAADGENFFRVEANDLVQQKLSIKNGGRYQLVTTSQGQSVNCRLDDGAGWPVDVVPTSCSAGRDLNAGTYLWTQLPLTVESMRHTKIERVRDEVVLKGTKPHAVEFFRYYKAELGPDGKDEFLFSLPTETKLDVVLTGAMQGRVYLLEADKAPKAVEVVPPTSVGEPEHGGDYEGEGESEQPPPEAYAEANCEEGCPEPAETPTAAVQPVQAVVAPPPPSGVSITLPAGSYKLVTEHSRGDVGIEYQLHLGTATLLPGMARTLPTPTQIPLVVPKDGTLRLRTEGDADVRCRLFDKEGRLVADNSENGSDWNCALAEPIVKGTYTLVIESETQQRGETKVIVATPATEDKGVLTDAAKLTLAQAVVSLSVPVAEKEAVQEVVVRAAGKTPFSCAVEDATGQVIARKGRIAECAFLIRPKLLQHKLRLWTTDGTAQVTVSYRSRPIADGAKDIPAQQAVSVTVPKAGRYATASQAFCLPSAQTGVLRVCGAEASLESGPVVFATYGTNALSLAMTEVKAAASEKEETAWLTRSASLLAVTATAPSVFLQRAAVQYGERVGPACGFDGPGAVKETRERSCFAVGRVGTEALARTWAASDRAVATGITRTAVALPASAQPLSLGRKSVTFKDALLLKLPATRTRVELTVPAATWTVLLDDAGNALDLCAPTADLTRCSLTGTGGHVLLAGALGQAEVLTTQLDTAPKSVEFTGLYEDTPRQPGSTKLRIAAAKDERVFDVDGALKCSLLLADGTRTAGCSGKVAANQSAELYLEFNAGALRTIVTQPGRERWAKLGQDLPVVPGANLSASIAVPLQSNRTDKTIVVDKDSVVRITADNGVVGLFKGNDLLSVDGFDTGGEIVRVVSPGTYRVLVRPFAGLPVTGALKWTQESVVTLSEGVAEEQWLAPGDVRLYRFTLSAKGRVGLGLQAKSELLSCAVYNDGSKLLGQGCHQYLQLDKGSYFLTVRNPPRPSATPIAYKPVLLGLAGDKNDVPDEYLQDFFSRVQP